MHLILRSTERTLALGKKIGRLLKEGSILCLFGEFGSGKTTLVKGIAEGLGIKKNKVISPSFILLREYKGRKTLYHFDLYRLKSIKEILDIGYAEYLYDKGIVCIEWADRLKGYLPKTFLELELSIKDKHTRLLKLKAHGPYYRQFIKRLK